MKRKPGSVRPSVICGIIVLACAGLAVSGRALAGEGVIEINHSAALAGGVTPGDTPGYPVTLTRSGSFRLTGDLLLPSENTTGIEVLISQARPRVAIDLNGFSIVGPTTCTGIGSTLVCSPLGTGTGIRLGTGTLSTAPAEYRISNGSVIGAGAAGIRTSGGSATRLTRLSLIGNGGTGASLFDHSTQIRDCIVAGNLGDGIRANLSASVFDSVVFGNGGVGIGTDTTSTLRGNVVHANGGDGVQVGAQVLVLENALTGNAGVGLAWPATAPPTPGAYGQNVIEDNVAGTVAPSGVELGTNLCGGNTTCP